MFEVEVDGNKEVLSDSEFFATYDIGDKKELYKAPFDRHVLHRGGKTINVTYKEV